MKTMLLVVLALMLGGCAMSKAPFACWPAKEPEVEKAVKEIMKDIPESEGKETASLILRVTKISADAGCVAAKAVEAQKAQ